MDSLQEREEYERAEDAIEEEEYGCEGQEADRRETFAEDEAETEAAYRREEMEERDNDW